MSVDESHRILLKMLEYVLITSKNDKATENICPIEIGVQFPILESTVSLSQIAVYKESVCLHPFDVQNFSKVMKEEKKAIKNLQSKADAPCLSVIQYMDGKCTQFTFYYSDCLYGCCNIEEKMNQEHGQLLIKSIEESKSVLTEIPVPEKIHFSILLNAKLLQNAMTKLECFTVNFMKKYQIINPYLTITYSTNIKYKRFVMNGSQPEMNSYLENITSYFRNVNPAELITPVYSMVKNLSQKPHNLSISIFYTSAGSINIGMKNHFHLLFFSKHGLPLNIKSEKWHSAIQISTVRRSGIDIEPSSDCSDMIDVCYNIRGLKSSACFLAIFLVENLYVLEEIMEHHNSLVATFLIEIVQKMIFSSEIWEKDKMYSKMVATSLGSILRFSHDSEFREQCLLLLQACDSMDAETKLDDFLIKYALRQ